MSVSIIKLKYPKITLFALLFPFIFFCIVLFLIEVKPVEKLSGRITGTIVQIVTAPIEGNFSKVLISDSSPVDSGDIICHIDSEKYALESFIASACEELANNSVAVNNSSLRVLIKKQAQLKKQQFEESKLYAKNSGYFYISKDLALTKWISKGDIIGEIRNRNVLTARAIVKDCGVAIGQKAKVVVDSFPNRSFQGTIDNIRLVNKNYSEIFIEINSPPNNIDLIENSPVTIIIRQPSIKLWQILSKK